MDLSTLVKAKLSRLEETTSEECVGEQATRPLTDIGN
jgi:hypothetical protein